MDRERKLPGEFRGRGVGRWVLRAFGKLDCAFRDDEDAAESLA